HRVEPAPFGRTKRAFEPRSERSNAERDDASHERCRRPRTVALRRNRREEHDGAAEEQERQRASPDPGEEGGISVRERDGGEDRRERRPEPEHRGRRSGASDEDGDRDSEDAKKCPEGGARPLARAEDQ